MRIAQLAPLFESVPPKGYGGTERVVSYLTEELIRQGHDVTLYASADSITQARLIPGSPRSLRLDRSCKDPLALHVHMLERLIQQAERYDIIHSHIDYLPFPSFRRLSVPSVTTLHGRLDLPELGPVLREFDDMPLISISHAQRLPAPSCNWQGTVYHGLPDTLLKPKSGSGKYLAFLGRLSIEKRVDRAIEIARRTGLPLKVAAKVDPRDEDYFKCVAEPLLKGPGVEFIGEIDEPQKNDFLGDALALLFPIAWPEPFGMVLIEAMACGTPVIAYRAGSVPEIITDGTTGFIVSTLEEAIAAVPKAAALSRDRIRAVFDQRFTARAMADHYLEIYERLTNVRPVAPWTDPEFEPATSN